MRAPTRSDSVILHQGNIMSVIATAAPASAASPIVDLFNHGHKKGGHVGSSTDSSAASSAQGHTTNQGLFSSLLESLEQVIGVSLTAPATAASATTAAAAAGIAGTAPTGIASATASGGIHSASTLGANVNAKV
jgi:hypothetical protein